MYFIRLYHREVMDYYSKKKVITVLNWKKEISHSLLHLISYLFSNVNNFGVVTIILC